MSLWHLCSWIKSFPQWRSVRFEAQWDRTLHHLHRQCKGMTKKAMRPCITPPKCACVHMTVHCFGTYFAIRKTQLNKYLKKMRLHCYKAFYASWVNMVLHALGVIRRICNRLWIICDDYTFGVLDLHPRGIRDNGCVQSKMKILPPMYTINFIGNILQCLK